MFSGIINTTGSVKEIIDCGGDKRFIINTGDLNLENVAKGDSICINGVCLTAVDINIGTIEVDVSAETLSCTNFNQYVIGSRVNLEKSLQLTDRFSGHIVNGHVDGVGTVVSVDNEARSTRYLIEVPVEFCRYLCQKGSICIDGVSLTINEVHGSQLSVNIIPFTREHTIFSDYAPGTRVNFEVDIIARYLESLSQYRQ
jgi:riboflavin synthase